MAKLESAAILVVVAGLAFVYMKIKDFKMPEIGFPGWPDFPFSGDVYDRWTTDNSQTWQKDYERQKEAAEEKFDLGITKTGVQQGRGGSVRYVDTFSGVGGGSITRWYENLIDGKTVIAPATVRAENYGYQPASLRSMKLHQLKSIGGLYPSTSSPVTRAQIPIIAAAGDRARGSGSGSDSNYVELKKVIDSHYEESKKDTPKTIFGG